jgi:hypothetical protein
VVNGHPYCYTATATPCPPGFIGMQLGAAGAFFSPALLCVKVTACPIGTVGAHVQVWPAAPIGNCASVDRDHDGWIDSVDDCPNDPDPAQKDTDADGVGNGCDKDVDGDGTLNPSDGDVDGDATPNGSDSDIDDDGMPNAIDPTPNGV